MAIVKIIPAEYRHCKMIIGNLRERDRHIFDTYENPEFIIQQELLKSNSCFSGFINGEIVCMWGIHVSTLLNDEAYIWMLTTKAIEDNIFTFIRQSKKLLNNILAECSLVRGYVVADNTRSIRWLKWLGFKFNSIDDPNILEFSIRRY